MKIPEALFSRINLGQLTGVGNIRFLNLMNFTLVLKDVYFSWLPGVPGKRCQRSIMVSSDALGNQNQCGFAYSKGVNYFGRHCYVHLNDRFLMKKKQSKKIIAGETNSKKLRARVVSEKLGGRLRIYLGILIAVFAFVLYSGSIGHDFALDDSSVVHENSVTKQGFSGIPTILKTDYWYGSGHNISRGPIYRPTSLIVYAIVWQFYQDNP